jgi:hypothetical protein
VDAAEHVGPYMNCDYTVRRSVRQPCRAQAQQEKARVFSGMIGKANARIA